MRPKYTAMRDRKGAREAESTRRDARATPAPFRINEVALRTALQRLETNYA